MSEPPSFPSTARQEPNPEVPGWVPHTHTNPLHAHYCYICAQAGAERPVPSAVRSGLDQISSEGHANFPTYEDVINRGYLEVDPTNKAELESLEEIPALYRRQRADFVKRNVPAMIIEDMIQKVSDTETASLEKLAALADPKRLRAGLDDTADWKECYDALQLTEEEKEVVDKHKAAFREIITNIPDEFRKVDDSTVDLPPVTNVIPFVPTNENLENAESAAPLTLPLLEQEHIAPKLGVVLKPILSTEVDLSKIASLYQTESEQRVPRPAPELKPSDIPDLIGPPTLFHYKFKETDLPKLPEGSFKITIPEKVQSVASLDDLFLDDFDNVASADIPIGKRSHEPPHMEVPLIAPDPEWRTRDEPPDDDCDIPVDPNVVFADQKKAYQEALAKRPSNVPSAQSRDLVPRDTEVSFRKFNLPARQVEFPKFLKDLVTTSFRSESVADVIKQRHQIARALIEEKNQQVAATRGSVEPSGVQPAGTTPTSSSKAQPPTIEVPDAGQAFSPKAVSSQSELKQDELQSKHVGQVVANANPTLSASMVDDLADKLGERIEERLRQMQNTSGSPKGFNTQGERRGESIGALGNLRSGVMIVPSVAARILSTDDGGASRDVVASAAAADLNPYNDLNYYTEEKRRGGGYVRLLKRHYDVKDADRHLKPYKGELIEPDASLLVSQRFQLQAQAVTVDKQEGGEEIALEKSSGLIFSCVRHNRFEDIKALLQEDGSLLDVLDEYGNSLLHVAVRNDNKRITKLLLKAGINIDAKNKEGDTPLHLAVRMKFSEIAQFLITSGADDAARNLAGVSPHMLMNAGKA